MTADFQALAEAVASGPVASNALAVDRDGAFPTASIAALGEAGLMGLLSAPEVGGLGQGLRAAATVVERLARECGSTAMVYTMHLCGAAVIEKHGSEALRKEVASGRTLTTLAFSEGGSRSHFWAPLSTATASGDSIRLDAKKSWVTSANHATGYVWSSRPSSGDGMSTMWYVPRTTPGLAPSRYDGHGLRGNDSAPIAADGAVIPGGNRLGAEGGGFDIMMGVVLPLFNVCIASGSVGLMEATTAKAAAHCAGTRHEHLGTSLADLATIRAYLARMRIRTDQARGLWLDTLSALETGRADGMLRVLEVKAGCAETALEVTALGMRVCGGAAYRRDVGVERHHRDAQAASVMAPTTDQLYDFIGKAVCGLPLF